MKSIDIVARAAVVGALLLAPGVARAQNATSETFFAEGRKLRLAGKCAEAIVAFRRSFELNPERIGSLRNIAECERELGRYASSRRSYWNLRRAALKSDVPSYQGWDRDAEKAYDEMTSKVPHLSVKVEGPTDGVTITVDSLLLDARLWGTDIEQDLGSHTVEARYGGVEPITEKVTLKEGERRVVTIRVPRAAGALRLRGGALTVPGFVALATGGAALVGMGIAAGVRGAALDTIEAECPTLRGCRSGLAGEAEKGRAAATAFNVLVGVAAVGVTAGAGLLIAGRLTGSSDPPKKPAAAFRLFLSPLPDAATFRLEGEF